MEPQKGIQIKSYFCLFMIISKRDVGPAAWDILEILVWSLKKQLLGWFIVKYSIFHPKFKILSEFEQQKWSLLSFDPNLESKCQSTLASYLFLSFNNTRTDRKLRRTLFSPFIFQFQRIIFLKQLPRISLSISLISQIRKVFYQIAFSFIKTVVDNKCRKLAFIFIRLLLLFLLIFILVLLFFDSLNINVIWVLANFAL